MVLLLLTLQVVFQDYTISIAQNQSFKCKYFNAVNCSVALCLAHEIPSKSPDQVRTSRCLCGCPISFTRGVVYCCLIFTGVCQAHDPVAFLVSTKHPKPERLSVQNSNIRIKLNRVHTYCIQRDDLPRRTPNRFLVE